VKLRGCRPILKSDKKRIMKADRSDGAANRTATKSREIDWAQAYEKRMRRFNMEVVLAALLALILVIVSWFFYQ